MPESYASDTIIILNNAGFHVRPITAFVQTATKYKCDITVKFENQTINGKSVLECTLLAATYGTELILEAVGEDAEEAIQDLVQLAKNKFGIED
ncbi:MAG: HPr family phosphocarrier protein [Candidatus Heimdallarchaeota archaeon]|nr:HPr family phosphocarrier protein [Candidatus Heimdallarchaeota archaeon]